MPMRSAAPRVTQLLPAALLALSGAGGAPAWAQAAAAPPSSIRVTGEARVSARPDRVLIDLGVQTQAPQSQDAAAANARQVEAVLVAVRKAAGPTGQLKTVSYALSPAYQYHGSSS